MRRKCKFRVYTNKTIRRSFTNSGICQNCKSVCKVDHCNFYTDPNSIADNHPGMNRTKKNLHKFGFGSLMPGRKFVYYDRITTSINRQYYLSRHGYKFIRDPNCNDFLKDIEEMELEDEIVWKLKFH